ncbi:MAG: trimeric intracellular cation channel family protein [Brevundimonas sp.]|uniref:trimeric intracellular cation channel family protein n=1 Tax=Brevundimonas sp. TaxID=1871086 RepID=UPI0027332DAD|nr:trimeric intracellular cation channel family protein [Brevundimonas sp.]MBX9617400.1 trimeric intracellular cation channel family protein [Caulobacteraceae bacterium]MDP3404852.1 trimeric intracellular cation channel family protein [Brevundimonas sp.]
MTTLLDPALIGPALSQPETVLGALDFAGVAVFAATGALAAAREKHDIVTFAFFAAVTGVGGGTLRDVLIDAPVFWVQDWRYIAVCLAGALAVWLVGAGAWRFRALLWLDAVGLGAYGVLGAAKAEAFGVSPLICIVMGVLTACFGGIVRDLLAGQPSILLRREITVSAAIVAATVYVVARAAGLDQWPAAAIAAPAGFALRAGALLRGWSLPGFPGGLVRKR